MSHPKLLPALRWIKSKPVFVIAIAGVIAGAVTAFYAERKRAPEPPLFSPAPNPYAQGIYANGIIESFQTNGENINIYPEVGGTVTQVLVSEGESVKAGAPLLQLDDSVQKATVEQLRSQAEAAAALLEELKAQPRKETLQVAGAQVAAAKASVRNVEDQLAKVQATFRLNPKSVSRNDLDNAKNAVRVARSNLGVATRQYELTRAGAWVYDIRNQQKQQEALQKQYEAARAIMAKYLLRAPHDGIVLSIRTAVGSYVSPQGVYGTYTGALHPILVMGGSDQYLQVRTYVDEILVHRLPDPARMTGQMFIQGTQISIPLEFVRLQPYVTPKIELSSQRQERVDVRVLPVIFKFEKPQGVSLYPGQLTDVYIGEKTLAQLPGKASDRNQPAKEQKTGGERR